MAGLSFKDPERHEDARDLVNSWLGRFSILVMDDSVLDVETLRERVKTVEALKADLDPVSQVSVTLDPFANDELIKTFAMAKSQLPTLERDLKAKLGKLKPGDPQSRPDLDALQERLTETAAKIELGVSPIEQYGDSLQLEPTPANFVASAGLTIFGLVWNGFTAVHAFYMIGGMWKAFGPFALLALAFYALFFIAGFAMFAGAYVAAAQEQVSFVGDEMTVERTLLGHKSRKRFKIDLRTPAAIGTSVDSDSGRQVNKSGIVLTRDDGRPVHIATTATEGRRETMLKKINGYLQAQAWQAA